MRIVKTRNDRLDQIISKSFSVSYDPPGDGNCQFFASSNSLLIPLFYRSPQSLLGDVANSLRDNRFLNGIPLDNFTARLSVEYLEEMAKDGVHGDEITLRYIANLFIIEITIISNLGNCGRASTLLENSHPFGRILLGHIAEGQGNQYVYLD